MRNAYAVLVGMTVFVAPLGLPESAFAEPVTLTSGFVSYMRQDPASIFSSGVITARYTEGDSDAYLPANACGPCVPGPTFNGSLTETFVRDPERGLWLTGTFEAGGEIVQLTTLSYTLTAATPVVVPLVAPHTVVSSASVRFLFEGLATGTLNGATRELALSGGGNLVVSFSEFGWLSSTYAFDNAAPTPEPGSLLLFGTGAAVLARRWRTRRGGATPAH